MTTPISPFHAGELAVQNQLGVKEKLAPFAARVVRDHMPDQHRKFYGSLPFILVGAVDQDGWPWASLLAGEAGFMSTPDEKTLNVQASLHQNDPLRGALAPGSDIGLLGLQLETRRRNRMNGHVKQIDNEMMSVSVHQAFGNCPQYIHSRSVSAKPDTETRADEVTLSSKLEGHAARLVSRADTMFIASSYVDQTDADSNGADVSHRGGSPGFVEILDEQRILFPDYSGNNHFNTIGNLVLNPKVGFLFVDFESGDLVYLSGEAEIIWSGPDVRARPGAQRLVKCNIRSVRHLKRAVALEFEFVDYSPGLPH
jgi:predicted pyridoxine 5'-phosphate oxidase superfamily flavin-nucleotide-binding protein